MTRVLCIVITIAVWAAPARAQTPLPLPQAIDEAIAHNPSLAAARAATRQADAERRMARAAWTPQITYAEAWQRSTQPVMGFGALLNGRLFTAGDFAVDRLNRPGETDAFVRRLSVQQLLFDANHASSALAMATRRP